MASQRRTVVRRSVVEPIRNTQSGPSSNDGLITARRAGERRLNGAREPPDNRGLLLGPHPSTSGEVGGELALSPALDSAPSAAEPRRPESPFRPMSKIVATPDSSRIGAADLMGDVPTLHSEDRRGTTPEPVTPWGFKSGAQATQSPRDAHQALPGPPWGFKSVSKLSTCSEQGEHRVDVSEERHRT